MNIEWIKNVKYKNYKILCTYVKTSLIEKNS